jgi:hypothetical protein
VRPYTKRTAGVFGDLEDDGGVKGSSGAAVVEALCR